MPTLANEPEHVLGPTSLLISSREAERLLGVSRWSVYRMVEEGVVEPIRLRPGSPFKFRRKDIYRLAGELDDGVPAGNQDEGA